MVTVAAFLFLWWRLLLLSCFACALGATVGAVPSTIVQCQDTELGHWQCGKSIGASFKARIQGALNSDTTLQKLFRDVHETRRGKDVFQSFVSHASQRYPLYMAELNGTAAGAEVSLDLVLLANLRQELAMALGGSVSGPPDSEAAVRKESMTLCMNCSDSLACRADSERVTYSPPVGRCYSPGKLWPQDQSWGPNDVLDLCNSSTLVRQLYASTDGTCAGVSTDRFEIPLNECVGPFGRPRPWGFFDCKMPAESLAGPPESIIPNACTDLLLVDSSRGTAGWMHSEEFPNSPSDSMYFVQQTVSNAHNKEVYSFSSFTYPGVLPGWAPAWNSFGLGMSWNMLHPSKTLTSPNVAVAFVRRDVLSARSVEEAIRRATPNDLGLGQNLNLGSFHSKQVVSIETAPGGKSDVLHIRDDATTRFHANEYLRLQVPQEVNRLPSSRHRKQAFERLAKQKSGGLQSMKHLLKVLGDMHGRNATTQDTLFTVAFDLNARTVTSYRGNSRLGQASQQWVEHVKMVDAAITDASRIGIGMDAAIVL